jgi:hypothetical protein
LKSKLGGLVVLELMSLESIGAQSCGLVEEKNFIF